MLIKQKLMILFAVSSMSFLACNDNNSREDYRDHEGTVPTVSPDADYNRSPPINEDTLTLDDSLNHMREKPL